VKSSWPAALVGIGLAKIGEVRLGAASERHMVRVGCGDDERTILGGSMKPPE
jgi:hypothetical protein